MKPITIDNLDIKDHVRWAQDQILLDPFYLKDSQEVAQHPEMLGLSSIYASQWEALFEWQKKNVPWASFAPPQKYHLANKRLFSFRLFPTIHWESEEEEKEDSSQQQNDQDLPHEKSDDLIKNVINLQTFSTQSTVLFEKDKSAILNLLESIKYLNELLSHVSARKLQYQKG